MIREINKVLRIVIVAVGSIAALFYLLGKNSNSGEKIKNAKNSNDFQTEEFDDIW